MFPPCWPCERALRAGASSRRMGERTARSVCGAYCRELPWEGQGIGPASRIDSTERTTESADPGGWNGKTGSTAGANWAFFPCCGGGYRITWGITRYHASSVGSRFTSVWEGAAGGIAGSRTGNSPPLSESGERPGSSWTKGKRRQGKPGCPSKSCSWDIPVPTEMPGGAKHVQAAW